MITQRFEDPHGRWAITVPQQWTPKPASTDSGGTDVAFLLTAPADPERWMDEAELDTLVVKVTPAATAELAGEIWGATVSAEAAAAGAERPSRLAARPAWEFVIDSASAGPGVRMRWVSLFAESALYLVVRTAAGGRYDSEEPLVATALDSFEVLAAGIAVPAADPFAGLSDEGRRLLLADADGRPFTVTIAGMEVFQLIEANLANSGGARRAAMRRLMLNGTPEDRRYACLLLVSWGDDVGFDTLQNWTREPSSAPALDASFDAFGSAVGRNRHPAGSALTRRGRQALGELLALVGRHDVAAGVADALSHPDDVRALLPEVNGAVQRCIEQVEHGVAEPFDILDDAAMLIGCLASVDDAGAACAAQQVIAASRRIIRATGAVALDFDPLCTLAGNDSGGARYQAVLTELAADPDEDVRLAARESLAAQREAASAVPPPPERKSRFRWLTG